MNLQHVFNRLSSENKILIGAKEQAKRETACDACEYKVKSPLGPTCTLCGCVLAFKIRLIASTCPSERWDLPNSQKSIT